ncbi:dedicator of cytokinesis protein 9-like isoform X11 [Haliotis rufescens]|uniref:dedicator of cytokinesis protein 9-like isoform X11 n=1 Tax=Haliotis rufescens TaxID=6454 RepID=UPI00201EEDB4|nr:dedicator of cytokinesis protein 9-like isoform X11 [Haliotis rufescens]
MAAHLTERKFKNFKEALRNRGDAAKIRESVSAALRESAFQARPKLVEPIDYETYVVQHKVLLHNDPQRDMLNFPHDDVEVPPPTPAKKNRTVYSTVPKNAKKQAKDLMVRQCIDTYTCKCHMIKFKYEKYAGSYQQLPAAKKNANLQEQLFEIDAEMEEKDDDTLSRSMSSTITRKGWLYKGPDSGKDNIISFTRQFKRRFFVLKQQTDFTYILEFFKDEKKAEVKGAVYLDLATDVIKNTKKGKFCFEIRMSEGSSCLFAADSEVDMEEWIVTLNKVISAAETASQVSRDSIKEDLPAPGHAENYKESSMNHPVVKYSRESDTSLSSARQEGRQNLFHVYPDMRRTNFEEEEVEEEDEIDVFPKQDAERFLLRLEEFSLKLQVNMADEGLGNKHCNPEPFFISFALYDAKEGKKISEDFVVDPNEPEISRMIPPDVLQASDKLHTVDGLETMPDLNGLKEDWLRHKRQGIFTVIRRHSEIYLVAKIEKVLQGGISQCVEPYVKLADQKIATKVHRQMKQLCNHIGHYRMPFAWSARPIGTTAYGHTNLPIYRQEGSKMSEEEIIKQLQDFKKPEKQSKLQSIPGVLRIWFEHVPCSQVINNVLTPSLVPVHPFPNPPAQVPAIEVQEFVPDKAPLYTSYDYYLNHLYVYPLALKYDSQKTFTKARNIACCIEMRDSDDEGAVPLKCIYGRPHTSVFTTEATTAVLHHNTTPEFTEEVKIALPTQLNEKHHLLLKLYHVSCEASKTGPKTSSSSLKSKNNIEFPIGFAWLPLLGDGRISVGERTIKVAVNLPPGYLNSESLGLGRGVSKNSGPDIKWVEGGRSLFKLGIRLMSTIYTQDQHLHNFFQQCQKMESDTSLAVDMNSVNKLKSDSDDSENSDDSSDWLSNLIKSLLAVEVSVYIQFLPTLLNQLFHLLARTANEDVGINAVRVLIHVVSEVHDNSKEELLQKYVKYIFRPDPVQKGSKQKTVHEELARSLTSMLRPANADPLVIRKFLEHAWFIFEILIKSMTQYLIDTDRVKMPRNERFSPDYQYRVQNLLQIVVTLISQRHQEEGTQNANRSLAFFVKNCFTLMDRGFVFKLVAKYIEIFNVANNKELWKLYDQSKNPSCSADTTCLVILHQFKFEFLRIVSSHEHYIPLCLPMMRRGRVKNFKEFKPEDLRQDYTLSEEFRKTHYLVGLLIHELKQVLVQPRDMRRCAITVLRNQLAKHAFDDRYVKTAQQGRIAALYLPLISVLLENKNRLIKDVQSPTSNSAPKPPVANGDAHGLKPPSNQSKQPAPPAPPPAPEQRPSSTVFDMIGGVTPYSSNMPQLNGRMSRTVNGSSISINSDSSSSTEKGDRDVTEKSHARRESTATLTPAPPSPYLHRYDKLDILEIRDLLLCYLYVVKCLPEDILLGWFNNSSENDIVDFFTLLGVCLHQFRYQGRKRIYTLSMIGDTSKKALSLPSSRKSIPGSSLSSGRTSMYSDVVDGFHTPTSSDADAMMRALKEANMTTEVGLVVLDILGLYCQYFKKDMEAREGENAPMKAVFRLYLTFLRTSQSETLQKHVFAALRGFIKKFQIALFKGSASMCGELCYEILRCCSSKLNSTRREACALLYLLMRTNFEYSNKKSFTRVHLQVIISVSQLIGDVMLLSTSRFQESLAIVNNYANTDRGIQKTPFPGEVKDLTKRIRTVLMATAQMKENENDPELLVDLQYSLAKSYASTPELRKTWLDSMAKLHNKNGDFSEAAHCYIHIAALIAEYLKKRGKLRSRAYPQGCTAFSRVSPNIAIEESGIKDDSGMEDVQYTEETLVDFLEQAAQSLEKAERYELLGEIYKLIIPIYEKTRNFQKLQASYDRLSGAYHKVIEVMYSGKRLLGKYYRVAFFGQTYFEDDDGKEYIYKEPKVTSLTEICERLKTMYAEKFGKDNIRLIQSDNKVNPAELDARFAHIQVTYVTPYFDEKELAERLTDYERNNNIRRFMFETPFTKDGKSHGNIDEQCKRRTILLTSHTFPYVKKRIDVKDRKEYILKPIEVAIDQMQCKVAEMKEVLNSPAPDLVKLQLKLQGSVNAQVNAGPLAYAEVFLDPKKVGNCKPEKVEALKDVFREFVNTCRDALELNAQLITTDQKEYHESLKTGFNDIVDKLSVMFGEKMAMADTRNSNARLSMTFFPNSGSSNA